MSRNRIDRVSYKHYVFNPHTSKIVSGWEYKSDALDHIKEIEVDFLKVYSRGFLVRKGFNPVFNKNWSDEGLGEAAYSPTPEVVLYGNFRKDAHIPEMKIRYNKGKPFEKIMGSNDVYRFLKRVYGRSIELQEQFILLFLDSALNVIGYYKHTVGTPISVMADIPMLLGIMLKSMTRRFIASHNHPAGTASPSDSDTKLTMKLAKAAKSLDIQMDDHIIVTKNNGYYSFADEGHISLSGTGEKESRPEESTKLEDRLREEIYQQLHKVNQNPDLTPKVYDLIQTQKGYEWMEKRIIGMLINDRITVSACIPQIESELP